MRETLISILALLALAPLAKTSDIGKDGFNLYKDYFRARSDDVESPASAERMLYFYRAPLLYPGLLPAVEQEYRKRTGNAFKNHLLSKEFWADDAGEGLGKRSSKTAISLIMQGKHPYYAKKCNAAKFLTAVRKLAALHTSVSRGEEHHCPYGKRGRW